MRKIFKFDNVNSTNDLLLQWAENDSAIDRYVIWALNQSKGKGQHGRIWESNSGENLTFSILIRHKSLEVMDQFIFNKAISVAVFKALQFVDADCKIKWPNDIFIKNNKVSGILIENSLKGKYLDYSVVGIGVNVNQKYFPDYVSQAGSLAMSLGVNLDLNLLLNQIVDHIEYYVSLVYKKRISEIESLYYENLFKRDVISVFKSKDITFNGIIRNVDEFGRLMVELEDDKIKIFNNGEIRLLL